MKKIFILIAASFLVFSCSDFAKKCLDFVAPKNVESAVIVSEEFVQGSEDIPLLVGMEKISDDSVGFDSNSGSIISSSYVSENDKKQIRDFYLKTLPQMGWQIVKNVENESSFKRDREKLEIEFVAENGKKVVRFFLSSVL